MTTLIEFVQGLIDDPLKLRRYKQNPHQYLVDEVQLSQDDVKLWKQIAIGAPMEVSTVMKMRTVPSPSNLKEPIRFDIPLTGLEIHLLSRGQHFLAELNEFAPDDHVHCYLLRRSELRFSEKASDINYQVNFDLRLCYVDPRNKYDEAQVLHIRTRNFEAAIDDNHYELNQTDVQFTIQPYNYMLLRADEEVTCILDEHSTYNPDTHELILSFTN